MVTDQLAQRWLVLLIQDIAELVRVGAAKGEIRAVGLAQGADQRVHMLAADLAILIAMSLDSHDRAPVIMAKMISRGIGFNNQRADFAAAQLQSWLRSSGNVR